MGAGGGMASKQLLDFIFTSFSHVRSNRFSGTIEKWTVTLETSLFEPFRALSLSF